MIIAVTGSLENARGEKRIAGAGKDEAAKALVSQGFVSVSFSDVMKRICVEVFGFTREQCWGPSEERAKPDKRYSRYKDTHHLGPGSSDGQGLKCVECGQVFEKKVENGVTTFTPPKNNPRCEVYLTVRYALQRLGDWGRDCHPDIWANKALETAKKLLKKPHDCRYTPQDGISYENIQYGGIPLISERNGVVLPDCRFQNEFRRVKEEGGIVIRVKRKCNEFPSRLDDSHVSERDILAWGDEKFDHVIENNGTVAELHYEVLKALGLPTIKFPAVVSY